MNRQFKKREMDKKGQKAHPVDLFEDAMRDVTLIKQKHDSIRRREKRSGNKFGELN